MTKSYMHDLPILNGQFPVRSSMTRMMTCLISGMDMVGSRMKFFTVPAWQTQRHAMKQKDGPCALHE